MLSQWNVHCLWPILPLESLPSPRRRKWQSACSCEHSSATLLWGHLVQTADPCRPFSSLEMNTMNTNSLRRKCSLASACKLYWALSALSRFACSDSLADFYKRCTYNLNRHLQMHPYFTLSLCSCSLHLPAHLRPLGMSMSSMSVFALVKIRSVIVLLCGASIVSRSITSALSL